MAKKRFISFLMAASITASLCTPAWATMDVTTSTDGIAGENKDITVGVSGVDASDDIVYGTTIVWEDPTFTYTVDGGASTRWDPETHTYVSAAGAVNGSFDKDSISVKVYNHSNAKIDASCFVGASADATTTSYSVSGYDVALSISNPDGNAATLPAPEPNSELDAVSTLFTLCISGTGMTKYASDLIASATNASKLGVVVVNIGPWTAPPKPVFAKGHTWWRVDDCGLPINGQNVKTIKMVDSYTPTGNELASWDASAAMDGSVMCYITEKIECITKWNGREINLYSLTISGNGYGAIYANEDSSNMFHPTEHYNANGELSSGQDPEESAFLYLTKVEGLELLNTSEVKNSDDMFGGFPYTLCKDLGLS